MSTTIPAADATVTPKPEPRVYLKEYKGIKIGDAIICQREKWPVLGGTVFCFITERDKEPQAHIFTKIGTQEVVPFSSLTKAPVLGETTPSASPNTKSPESPSL